MRQIDNMSSDEIETLRLKGMLGSQTTSAEAIIRQHGIEERAIIDRKRVELLQTRIDACDTLLDYLHDDVPWKDQQPLMDLLKQRKHLFEAQILMESVS